MAARAEVGVEQPVVAVDVGAVGAGELASRLRRLDLGRYAARIEPVQLLANRLAAHPVGRLRGPGSPPVASPLLAQPPSAAAANATAAAPRAPRLIVVSDTLPSRLPEAPARFEHTRAATATRHPASVLRLPQCNIDARALATPAGGRGAARLGWSSRRGDYCLAGPRLPALARRSRSAAPPALGRWSASSTNTWPGTRC